MILNGIDCKREGSKTFWPGSIVESGSVDGKAREMIKMRMRD